LGLADALRLVGDTAAIRALEGDWRHKIGFVFGFCFSKRPETLSNVGFVFSNGYFLEAWVGHRGTEKGSGFTASGCRWNGCLLVWPIWLRLVGDTAALRRRGLMADCPANCLMLFMHDSYFSRRLDK